MPHLGCDVVFGLCLLLAILAAGCQKKSDTPPTKTVATLTTKTGVAMVLVPAGDFIMGDQNGDDEEKPAHPVHVSAFYMDVYEVTQKSYEALMGTNPAKFKGADRPVERVSWLAAVKYCNMRSLREGFTPCYDAQTFACNLDADGYRLPTEAEWEYACRAGSRTAYSSGDSDHALADAAWYQANAAGATHPVGQKQPNAFGLYDVHGNVAEWCNDFYADDSYVKRQSDNPPGPAPTDKRVLRGGSWRSPPDRCRAAARAGETPGLADVCFGYEAYGLRCVRRPAASSPPTTKPAP